MTDNIFIYRLSLLKDSNIIINKLIFGLSNEQGFVSLRTDSCSVLQLPCHQRNFAAIFKRRIDQVLQNHHDLLYSRSGNKEERASSAYRGQKSAKILEELNLARAKTISKIKAISSKTLHNSRLHKIYGKLSLMDILATIGKHDINHIKQLTKISKQI